MHGSDALIVDGTESAVYFVGCGSGCYTSPGGDFTRLSSSTATGSLVFKREFPDSSRAEYDNLGFLQRVISRTLVDTTSFVYDGLGRLTQITNPFRKSGTTALYTRISYLTQGIEYIEEPGQVSSQTGGRRTLITVNATDSTLRKWEEPGGLGILTTLRYNAAGLLERLINPRNDTTRFVYTAITMKTDSIISPYFLKYPALSAADSAWLRTHVKAWQVASVPLTTTAAAPFSPGRVNKIVGLIKESGGQVTTFTPDRWGQPLVTTELPAPHPLQRKTTITRNPVNGLALSILSHTGALDQFTYHPATGLPATIHLAGQNLTIIDYGPFAQVQAIWGAGQPMRTFVHGPRGRVDQAKVIAATTYTTQYAYDTRYRVTSTTDSGGHITTFTYDPVYGNLNTSTAPGARTTTTVFDGYGRDSTLVAMTLPKRTLLYDPLNRVTQDILAASGPIGQATTVYSYGDKINLTSVTDAENNVYQYVFNALGAVTQHTDPYGTSEKSLYDAEGRLAAWVSRIAGDTVFRTYDDLHRPRETRVKRGATVMRRDSLSYAASGLWVAGENFASRDTIYLDATGWTTSIATRLASNWTQRFLRTYTKDANGRLDSVHVTYPGSIAATGRKYVWDGTTGALTAARVNGVGPALGFNTELLPSSMSMPGGVTATLGSISIHDPYRQKYNTTALDGSFWRSFNYDQLGRVDIQYGMNGVNLGQRSFIYDARSRLRSVHDSTFLTGGSLCEGQVDENNGGTLCQAAPTPVFNARDSVAYSAVGNVSYLSTPAVSDYPTYNRNRLKTWPRAGGTFSYVVDTAGFRTRVNKGTTPWTFYRWTPDGLLDTVRVGAGSNVVRRIKYDYNAFGELVRRSIDGTVDRHFLWDRGNLLAELNGTLTARRSEYAHFPGLDAPFALLTGATTIAEVLMVQRDPLGNVLGLTTTAGAVKTDQLRTSEWGQLFTLPAVNDTTTMRLRWKGMMYEADSTQLYYVRARWYDPQSRRFLSEDPIGIEGGMNPFTFGDSDPINHSDPEGLEWVCTDQMTWVFSSDLNGGWNSSTEWHSDCDWKDGGINWDGILGSKGGSGRGGGGGGWASQPGTYPAPSEDDPLCIILNSSADRLCLAPPVGSIGRVVIGENMGRVIPYAKQIGASWYKARGTNPANWLRNQAQWMRRQIAQGKEIVDIGPDPLRRVRSIYYELEREILRRTGYPTTRP